VIRISDNLSVVHHFGAVFISQFFCRYIVKRTGKKQKANGDYKHYHIELPWIPIQNHCNP